MKELREGLKVKIKFNISQIRSVEIECSIRWFELDRIALNYPEDMMNMAGYLHEGQVVEAVIYTDNGIRLFESLVIDSPFNADFVIEYDEQSSNIQRREYVRTAFETDILIFNDNSLKMETKTIDIGGGGIRFYTDRELNIGENLNFRLYFPDSEIAVDGSGEVIYMLKKDDYMYSVLKYIYITESSRNKIIKLCFEKEANRLRKL